MPDRRRITGRLALGVLVLLAAPAAGCRTLSPPEVAAVAGDAASQIRAALAASADGWNRGDLDAHLAPYADTATFMTSGGPERGRARTRELLERAFWSGGRPKQQLDFSELDVRPLGGSHALVTGRFRLSGGGEAEKTGRFSLVWGRTAEGWRILHDHSS